MYAISQFALNNGYACPHEDKLQHESVMMPRACDSAIREAAEKYEAPVQSQRRPITLTTTTTSGGVVELDCFSERDKSVYSILLQYSK